MANKTLGILVTSVASLIAASAFFPHTACAGGCFPVTVDQSVTGAYFHKVQTGSDPNTIGLTGVAVLPQVAFDPSRMSDGDPLDTPSVYMGGNAGGKESDVGLSWDRVYMFPSGQQQFTDTANGTSDGNAAHQFHQVNGEMGMQWVDGNGNIAHPTGALVPDHAFRPFWRTTNCGSNQWNNADIHGKPKTGMTPGCGDPQNDAPKNVYFYPGAAVRMTVKMVGTNKLELQVVDTCTGVSFDHSFTQDGFNADDSKSFKRVNSIDQAHNEDKGIKPTLASATGGGWQSVSILRAGGSSVPMSCGHGTVVEATDTAPHYSSLFHATPINAAGGFGLDITPDGEATPAQMPAPKCTVSAAAGGAGGAFLKP